MSTRFLVAFPGGWASAVGLVLYSRTVRNFSSGVAANFILAGVALICYAILNGLIPSVMVVPVLSVKNIMFRG